MFGHLEKFVEKWFFNFIDRLKKSDNALIKSVHTILEGYFIYKSVISYVVE